MVVETLYEIFDDAVFHGGTAIWRCYKGHRFSEDVDFYLKRDIKKIDQFYEALQKKGLLVERKKISENSIYSTLKLGQTFVRFEAIFKKSKGKLHEYEKAEGSFITVYTLTPEELVKEKVETYLNRLKVRDLYDIFFLLRHVEDNSDIKKDLNKLLKNFKRPVDEKELKVLITEGLVPNVEEMLTYIRRKA